jgi:hypothetical protein
MMAGNDTLATGTPSLCDELRGFDFVDDDEAAVGRGDIIGNDDDGCNADVDCEEIMSAWVLLMFVDKSISLVPYCKANDASDNDGDIVETHQSWIYY